jgi:hypothetical protein
VPDLSSTPVFLGLLALILSYPAVTFALWLKRRAALREFAATHGLRFRGILPSDKYAPYTRFDTVRRGVLLYNVMEGRANDVDVAVFDLPRSSGTCTGVIVSLPKDGTRVQVIPPEIMAAPRVAVGERVGHWTRVALAGSLGSNVVVLEALPGSAAEGIGSHTAAVLRSGTPVFLETQVGYLLVSPMRQIAPADLSAFLGFVASVARALEADGQKR